MRKKGKTLAKGYRREDISEDDLQAIREHQRDALKKSIEGISSTDTFGVFWIESDSKKETGIVHVVVTANGNPMDLVEMAEEMHDTAHNILETAEVEVRKLMEQEEHGGD